MKFSQKISTSEPLDITSRVKITYDGINPITNEPLACFLNVWSFEEYGNAYSDEKTVYRRNGGMAVPRDIIRSEVLYENKIESETNY